MSENFLKEHLWILTICAVLLLLTLQRFTFVFAVMATIPAMIWLIYSVFLVCIKAEKRQIQLVKMLIVLITAAIIASIHGYRSEAARHSADEIVFKLQQYQAEHGVYPANLELIGQDSHVLKQQLMLNYGVKDGQPILVYASIWNAFDRFYYDFQQQMWLFHPD